MRQIYIIEHLEPKIWDWCLIEYKHMKQTVGKNNLWFTNIKRKSKASRELSKYGKVFKKSVKEMNLDKVCVLDSQAEKVLEPNEAKRFKYFVFGGILGDYPPRKRTKKELTRFVKGEARNIGKKQFATDCAVYVTYKIAHGDSLKKMNFQNKYKLPINKVETIILPYIYPIVHGKAHISEELIELLKGKKGF